MYEYACMLQTEEDSICIATFDSDVKAYRYCLRYFRKYNIRLYIHTVTLSH